MGADEFTAVLSKWPWLVFAAILVLLFLLVFAVLSGRKVSLPGGIAIDPPVGKPEPKPQQAHVSGLDRASRLFTFVGSCLRSLADALKAQDSVSAEVDAIVAATVSYLPQSLHPADSAETFYRVACFVPDDTDLSYLVMSFNSGYSREEAARIRLPIDHSVAGRAYRAGAAAEPIYVPDVRQYPNYWVNPVNPPGFQRCNSLYCMCLEDGAGDKIVLNVSSTRVDGLSPDDRHAVGVVAALISVLMSVKGLAPSGLGSDRVLTLKLKSKPVFRSITSMSEQELQLLDQRAEVLIDRVSAGSASHR